MPTFPPFPSWPALHPLAAHIPLVLLFIAPLLILCGAARKPDRGFPFLLAALIVMALGTLSIFAAASSGGAAESSAANLPRANAVLQKHRELAETTEIAFTALTLIFASILYVPKLLKREPTVIISTNLPLVFLVFYLSGIILLANTTQQGRRLARNLTARDTEQPAAAAIQSAAR